MAAAPTAIDIDPRRALTLTWPDGRGDELSLATLRAACPCAACSRGRDEGTAPTVPEGLEVAGSELVGAYGLALAWTDGHNAGVYPWSLLAQLSQNRPNEP